MAKCICPKCKSDRVVPIIYDYPGPELWEEEERGNIKLGGCEVIDGGFMPDRFCKACNHEWSVYDFLAEDITKIRFRYWSNWGLHDAESLSEGQWAFEFFPDGVIRYFAYPMTGRKVLDKDATQITPERVIAFYNEIIMLYQPWNIFDEIIVCDGCSYELTITYADGRKKKMHGDIGGGAIDKTVMDFIASIPEMKDKIDVEEELE